MVAVFFIKPAPVSVIFAHSRSERSDIVVANIEFYCFTLCAANAKRPVKPFLARVAKLLFYFNRRSPVGLFIICGRSKPSPDKVLVWLLLFYHKTVLFLLYIFTAKSAMFLTYFSAPFENTSIASLTSFFIAFFAQTSISWKNVLFERFETAAPPAFDIYV